MNEEASALVVELAGEFIGLLRNMGTNWEKAYLRFCHEGLVYGSNASYVCGSEATIVDAFELRAEFKNMNTKAVRLLESLGKKQGLLLLIVDSQMKYDILFEFEDLKRWRITKLDGATGIPEGI